MYEPAAAAAETEGKSIQKESIPWMVGWVGCIIWAITIGNHFLLGDACDELLMSTGI